MTRFFLILASFLLVVGVLTVNVFPAQYEFDESLTKIADQWSFMTSFREHTKTSVMDLELEISYLNNEQTEIFKNNVDVHFNFYPLINPFCYFQYEDGILEYKRLGAGLEILLGESRNVNGWILFKHKARLSASYDSSDGDIYGVLSYAGDISLPRSDYSVRELVGISLDAQIAGFGNKYSIDGECQMTEELSTFASYTHEQSHGNESDIFKQGIRIRI